MRNRMERVLSSCTMFWAFSYLSTQIKATVDWGSFGQHHRNVFAGETAPACSSLSISMSLHCASSQQITLFTVNFTVCQRTLVRDLYLERASQMSLVSVHCQSNLFKDVHRAYWCDLSLNSVGVTENM